MSNWSTKQFESEQKHPDSSWSAVKDSVGLYKYHARALDTEIVEWATGNTSVELVRPLLYIDILTLFLMSAESRRWHFSEVLAPNNSRFLEILSSFSSPGLWVHCIYVTLHYIKLHYIPLH